MGAPLAATATVALGLRIGAKDTVRAAEVHGAPPSKGRVGIAWQALVIEDNGTLREPVAELRLTAVARTPAGEATWSGTTQADGTADMFFALPVSFGDPVHLEIREQGARRPLAAGEARWPAGRPGPAAPEIRWARFAAQTGEVRLDVAVFGERLVPGVGSPVWVLATDRTRRTPKAGATITIEPDTGFVATPGTTTTDARGWAKLVLQPIGHVVQVTLHARAAEHEAAVVTGTWAGGLSVAPGGSGASLPERIEPGAPYRVEVTAPAARSTAYVEVDDVAGRAAAGTVELSPDLVAGRRGTFEIPGLAPGLYWLVTAADPLGAGALAPSAVARPFFVAASDVEALAFGPEACDVAGVGAGPGVGDLLGPCLAVTAPRSSARFLALDGLAARRAEDAQRRARGLGLGIGAIVVASALVAIVLASGLLEEQRRRRAIEAGESPVSTGRSRLLSVMAGLLVALLGFALLAAMLVRFG